ncbi:MAG: MBL fold metallo-hydrolase [Desulfobacterales bacterium]|nr:MBL fold metallo-hydrolase [Desulfobacterales bacterium]
MHDFEKGMIKFIHGGRYPHCHSLFIDDERRALIDAASNEETLLAIQKERPVQILINSHGHEDHLLYNHLFPEAEFWVHEADAHVFRDVQNLIDCYGEEIEETERQRWADFLINSCHYVPRRSDRFLRHGEVIEFGEVRVEIVHTPGHTPGHCAFYFPEERILFTADLDLVKAGPYYGDVASSLEDTVESLNRLKSYPCDIYLTSHGRGVYEGDQIYVDRYLACIRHREEALIEFLRAAPRTLDDITDRGIIYGPKKAFLGPWDLSVSERFMMEKHLDFLIKDGLVRQEGKRFIYVPRR